MEWLATKTLEDLELAWLNLSTAIVDGQDVRGQMARWLRIYEILIEIKRAEILYVPPVE